VHFFYIIALN